MQSINQSVFNKKHVKQNQAQNREKTVDANVL